MKSQFALSLFLLALAPACRPASSPPVETSATPSTATPVSVSRTAPTEEPSDWSPPLFDGSIYDLDVEVTDQNGQRVALDVFRGHPVLVTMFYAGCPNACPLLTSDLKRIDGKLPPAARENLRVLMISFDAEHDTPQILTKHAQNHQLDPERWKLGSAKDDSAREIAGVIGIKYRKLDGGHYFHTSSILLLDETGRPKARIEGLGKNPEPILAALR